jgi:hypothetical protein
MLHFGVELHDLRREPKAPLSSFPLLTELNFCYFLRLHVEN